MGAGVVWGGGADSSSSTAIHGEAEELVRQRLAVLTARADGEWLKAAEETAKAEAAAEQAGALPNTMEYNTNVDEGGWLPK